MPRVLPTKKICEACRLHFYGETFQDIAILLDINHCTLTRWRKTDIWQNYEAKLLDEWHQQQQENANTS